MGRLALPKRMNLKPEIPLLRQRGCQGMIGMLGPGWNCRFWIAGRGRRKLSRHFFNRPAPAGQPAIGNQNQVSICVPKPRGRTGEEPEASPTASSGKRFGGSVGRRSSEAQPWGMPQSRSFPKGCQILLPRCNFWHELAIQWLGGEEGEKGRAFAIKRTG